MPQITEFPHRLQGFDYDCAPTAVMTLLHYFGKRVNEQEVIDALNTTLDGTATEEIEAGLKKFDLEFQKVYSIQEIDQHLDMGHPVLVCSQTDPRDWHYSVLVSRRGDDYITSDPWEIGLASIPVAIFDQIWLEEDGSKWGVAVFGEAKYTEAIHPLEVRLARTEEGRRMMGMRWASAELKRIEKELFR